MANLVEEILKKSAEKEAKYPTTKVKKPVELSIDAGNLLAVDQNPIDVKIFKAAKDQYLHTLARDNAQLLLNAIWKLPHERKDDVVLAKLPDPSTPIPREKPVPKERLTTRWQEFAKLKGVQNRKKGRMMWDATTKEWRPRWGHNRANDDTKDWLIEVPEHTDPYIDHFEKRRKAKSERVAKNELHRLRNIARSQKTKVPGVGITPTDNPTKEGLHRAMTLAKRSTASVGKFTESLPKEKPARGMAKKRKFEANIGDFGQERKHQLEIMRCLGKDKSSLNVTKAVNRQMMAEDLERRNEKSRRPGGKGKGNKKRGPPGGKGGSKSGKPPSTGKPGKPAGGGKRAGASRPTSGGRPTGGGKRGGGGMKRGGKR